MQWILVAGYTGLILALMPRIAFFRLPSIPATWLQGMFVLKVLAGISLGLVYSRYYTDKSTADTFKFFDDSRIIFESLRDNPKDFLRMFTGYHADAQDLKEKYYMGMTAWNNKEMFFNDNRSIIRLNVLFQFISLGYYYVHIVLLNLFSFTGLICIYKFLNRGLENKNKLFFLALFLFPSLLFWGSGLLKDGLLLFSVGIFLYFFQSIFIEKKISLLTVAGFLLGITGLLFNKFYILFMLLPAVTAYYFCTKSQVNYIRKFSIVYSLFALIFFSSKYVSPQFDFLKILETKRTSFEQIAVSGNARHILELPNETLTTFSFVTQIPMAFSRVCIRPYLWEADSAPVLLSALENFFLTLSVLLLLFFVKRGTKPIPLLLFSVGFILTLFIFIGMITPVLGAMVRYRIIGIPFLIFILLGLMDTVRVKAWFQKILNSKA